MKIPKDAEAFLKGEQYCVIATSSNRKTEAATMSAVFHEGKIIMFTSENTRKYANLRKNKNIALVFSSKNHSKDAQLDGVAKLVEFNDADEIISIILKRRPDLKEYIKNNEQESMVFIVVIPTRIYFVDNTKTPMKEVLIE